MKFSNLAAKLETMSDDEILDYLDNMQERGKYKKIEFDGEYANLFDFDPDDGAISWECEEHGYCEADFMDLFMKHGQMLRHFLETGCGLESTEN